MRTTRTTTIPVPHGTTVRDLAAALSELDADATVSYHVTLGDRPWDADTLDLQVTEERGTDA